MKLESPYPYFGGKSKAADMVWQMFGDVDTYVEPFFGSGAVLFGRQKINGIEVVNDMNGFIVNFWRSVKADPGAVVAAAMNPLYELDHMAWSRKLAAEREGFWQMLVEDPYFYDAEYAGKWVWGFCASIKLIFGVSQSEDADGNYKILRTTFTTTRGDGVVRKPMGITSDGKKLYKLIMALSERLKSVRVICGDYSRAITDHVVDGLKVGTGVFLDPPYESDEAIYGVGSENVAGDVMRWAFDNGTRPGVKIALCGFFPDEIVMPEGWFLKRWRAGAGRRSEDNNEHKLEAILFSPNCYRQRDLFDLMMGGN